MYTIEELELTHFNGMRLNNVSRFFMRVMSNYTVILGRNGCGKSRLMSMLSPLAPTKLDIAEGGAKRLVLNTAGTRYECISKNTKGNIKNTLINLTSGETILDGVNPTVFNGYMHELLHYNKELHDILTGQTLLSQMRTPDRRHWFSQLSESDLSYALKFYQQARKRQSTLKGAIDEARNTIGDLKPRVLASEEERVALFERINVLQNDISILDKALTLAKPRQDITEVSLDMIDSRLNTLNDTIRRTDVYVNTIVAQNDPKLLERELITLDANLQNALLQADDLLKRIERVGSAERIDIQKVYEQIDTLALTIAELKSRNFQFEALLQYAESDLVTALTQHQEFQATLIDGLTLLGRGGELKDLNQHYQALLDTTGTLSEQLSFKRNQIALREQRLDAITHVHDVECVQCNHVFKPGVKAGEDERLKEDLAKWRLGAEQTLAQLTEAKQQAQECAALVDTTRRLSELSRYFQSGAPALLFEYLRAHDAFILTPMMHVPTVQRFEAELKFAIEITRLTERKERLENEARIIAATQTEDIAELQSMKGKLDVQINTIQLRQRELRGWLNLIDTTNQRLLECDRLEQQLLSLIEQRTETALALIENVRVATMRDHRQELWDLLIVAKQRYEGMERERQNLEYMESQLTLHMQRHAVVVQIVKAMSPDTGILAKHLYQCITKVTDLMTAYINRIWGYEMKILPCDVADGELDYKFPFWAKDPHDIIPDVSMGSKGQKELIDFVFMLTVYRAMGLEQYPLFLDELGSAFDEAHRPSLITFVKSLVERGQHSSVFMVSHDAATHYQLSLADVVVLDPQGVTLPEKYNLHVEMS